MKEDLVGKIVEALDKELLGREFQNALRRAVDTTTYSLIDYLKGEYRLQLDDYIEERSRERVRALLKGDPDEARNFELIAHDWKREDGTPFITDNWGVRAAIVEQFKDRILTAETIALRERNALLSKQLEWSRR